ncbi:MAG: preprotein translocase subunit SecE [Steroidobacteraceae bacterium]
MTDETKIDAIGTADKAKLWVGVLAIVAGIAAYYLLGGEAAWLRWLYVAAGIAVAALVVGFSRYGAEFRAFAVSARVELRKIVWPTRNETTMTTVVVFVFVAVAGLFFWGLDLVLAWATRALTGQGG